MEEGLERTLSKDVGLCGRCELDFLGSSGTWTAPVQARVSSRLPLVGHSLSPFPPSHRAMDVRLTAMNLIISSAVLGTLRVSSRGRNKNYPPCFPVWRILHRSCLCWQIQPSIISPAKGPSNPPSRLGMSDKMAGFFRCSHQQIRFSFCIVAVCSTDLLDPSKRPQTTSLR